MSQVYKDHTIHYAVHEGYNAGWVGRVGMPSELSNLPFIPECFSGPEFSFIGGYDTALHQNYV